MVELVIKVSDAVIENIQRRSAEIQIDGDSLENAVLNGTVLPKGHGDLKDMNDLCPKSRYGCKGNCDYLHTCNFYNASTIIEADKESEV